MRDHLTPEEFCSRMRPALVDIYEQAQSHERAAVRYQELLDAAALDGEHMSVIRLSRMVEREIGQARGLCEAIEIIEVATR